MRVRKSRGAGRNVPRLFEPEELRLRSTGLARLRRLARRPAPSLTERERRTDEDRETMRRLADWGADLASRFGLRYTALQPERQGVNEHYGICYEDGLIRIRLRHATTGRLLKESSLVDTLCHELAHLQFMDHGPRFKELYFDILAEARRRGYYRPGRPDERTPRQGLLFDDGACGVKSRARPQRDDAKQARS